MDGEWGINDARGLSWHICLGVKHLPWGLAGKITCVLQGSQLESVLQGLGGHTVAGCKTQELGKQASVPGQSLADKTGGARAREKSTVP